MDLRQQMKLWRQGLVPMPQEYIAMHRAAAEADLARFCNKHALMLRESKMVSDGWGDGMKVLEILVQFGTQFATYRWSDANGGSWFNRGGLVEIAPNAPGHY